MDELPKFSRPEELNRVVSALASAGGMLSTSTLIDILKSTTCQGFLPSHEDTLCAAEAAGLVNSRSGELVLTQIGRQFLDLNSDQLYELAPGQARFLFDNLIQRPPYSDAAQALFRLFRTRGRDRGFSLVLADLTPSSDQTTLLALLRRLGIISISQGIVRVEKEYEASASAKRAPRAISSAELERLLLQQKMQGIAAENVIVEMERDRLRTAGFPIEAAAVTLISGFNVAAGYDIESFDGESTTLEPDRFIEVKSTATSQTEFFWSSNEVAIAEALKEKYWIYHLREFSLETERLATCIVLRDPSKLMRDGVLSSTCFQHRVSFAVNDVPTLDTSNGLY